MKDDERFGRQFKVSASYPILPHTETGLIGIYRVVAYKVLVLNLRNASLHILARKHFASSVMPPSV